MPITIAKLGRLRRADSLARAVYDLDDASPARVKAAASALERANPRLAAGDELKPDDFVFVPPMAKAPPREERNHELKVGRESYVDVIGERIGALVAAPALDRRKAGEAAEAQLRQLADKALMKRLASEYPGLEKELDAMRKAASEAIERRRAEAGRLFAVAEAMREEQAAAFAKMGIASPPSP